MGRNCGIYGILDKDLRSLVLILHSIFFIMSNQISRILLRPINRAEVIVKATSRKPKKLVIVGMKRLNEICSFYTYLYKEKALP